MKYKALLTLPQAWEQQLGGALEILDHNGIEVELVWSDTGLPQDELIRHLSGKHAHMMSLDIVNRAVISACKDLRVLAKHGIGLDNIDLKAATEARIPVCNTPGSNKYAVADHTMSLLLALCRKIGDADVMVREGKFIQMMGTEMHGKNLGIVGFGAIGKEVALRAKGFGMQVYAYDKYMDHTFCENHRIIPLAFTSLLGISDFVTVHVPLNQETRGLFNTQSIALMKRGSILINVARGGVVDEDACAESLHARHLAAVGFDVFSQEPPNLSGKLLHAPNTLFTTHMAGCTKESIARSAKMAATNIVEVLAGKQPVSIVNKDLYS